ncbi:MAG: hypothetical protein MMC33_001088 [Icmadophila ericetorum]|nr:hypothetical protein [Icmadophila ericetorum]
MVLPNFFLRIAEDAANAKAQAAHAGAIAARGIKRLYDLVTSEQDIEDKAYAISGSYSAADGTLRMFATSTRKHRDRDFHRDEDECARIWASEQRLRLVREANAEAASRDSQPLANEPGPSNGTGADKNSLPSDGASLGNSPRASSNASSSSSDEDHGAGGPSNPATHYRETAPSRKRKAQDSDIEGGSRAQDPAISPSSGTSSGSSPGIWRLKRARFVSSSPDTTPTGIRAPPSTEVSESSTPPSSSNSGLSSGTKFFNPNLVGTSDFGRTPESQVSGRLDDLSPQRLNGLDDQMTQGGRTPSIPPSVDSDGQIIKQRSGINSTDPTAIPQPCAVLTARPASDKNFFAFCKSFASRTAINQRQEIRTKSFRSFWDEAGIASGGGEGAENGKQALTPEPAEDKNLVRRVTRVQG